MCFEITLHTISYITREKRSFFMIYTVYRVIGMDIYNPVGA